VSVSTFQNKYSPRSLSFKSQHIFRTRFQWKPDTFNWQISTSIQFLMHMSDLLTTVCPNISGRKISQIPSIQLINTVPHVDHKTGWLPNSSVSKYLHGYNFPPIYKHLMAVIWWWGGSRCLNRVTRLACF